MVLNPNCYYSNLCQSLVKCMHDKNIEFQMFTPNSHPFGRFSTPFIPIKSLSIFMKELCIQFKKLYLSFLYLWKRVKQLFFQPRGIRILMALKANFLAPLSCVPGSSDGAPRPSDTVPRPFCDEPDPFYGSRSSSDTALRPFYGVPEPSEG